MGIYAEALILYILIFFSGSAAFLTGAAPSGEFSAIAVLAKLLLHIIPSLALIWYLVYKAKMLDIWAVRFGRKDMKSAVCAFPCLLAAGIIISLLSSYSGNVSVVYSQIPSTIPGWAVLCVFCMFSAYLEESYFRFYLLSKREELNLHAPGALVLSTIMFSVCHIYGGPWSFLNALISGSVLGFLFLRYNSLHGLAIAHGLYNITAYIIMAAVRVN